MNEGAPHLALACFEAFRALEGEANSKSKGVTVLRGFVVALLLLSSLCLVIPRRVEAQSASYSYVITVVLSPTGCSANANPVYPSVPLCTTGTLSGTSCTNLTSGHVMFNGSAFAVMGISPATYSSGLGQVGGSLQPVVWQTSGSTSRYWISGTK
jgi:hypothetical protein